LDELLCIKDIDRLLAAVMPGHLPTCGSIPATSESLQGATNHSGGAQEALATELDRLDIGSDNLI